MSRPPGPPSDHRPGDDREAEEPAPIADVREEFARESARASRDRKAERAFLKNKIEIARSDRKLSESEKAEAVAALLRELDRLEEEDPDSRP
ncbi:hypothetical protein GCM10010319_05290 [Streptomyces blastmyceticus]|uniref:Uncharacterized protein n=1 Tax=Streptomyces blastmyceticus TaxID=68180 RepID=A0ABN0WC99_9ACTN